MWLINIGKVDNLQLKAVNEVVTLEDNISRRIRKCVMNVVILPC